MCQMGDLDSRHGKCATAHTHQTRKQGSVIQSFRPFSHGQLRRTSSDVHCSRKSAQAVKSVERRPSGSQMRRRSPSGEPCSVTGVERSLVSKRRSNKPRSQRPSGRFVRASSTAWRHKADQVLGTQPSNVACLVAPRCEPWPLGNCSPVTGDFSGSLASFTSIACYKA